MEKEKQVRKSISKKLRFTVFERDNFTCQYCGKTPEKEDTVLQVDHVISVKNGGENDIQNLLTSCFECNIGKGARSTIKKGQPPKSIEEELKRTRERLGQVLAMNEMRKKIVRVKNKIRDEETSWVKEALVGSYTDEIYKGVQKVVKTHNFRLDIALDALEITESRHNYSSFESVDSFISYFFGVCRNLSLTEEEREILYFWRAIFRERSKKMFDTTRKIILKNSYLPLRVHEEAYELAQMDSNFVLRNGRLPDFSFNNLICECLDTVSTPDIE